MTTTRILPNFIHNIPGKLESPFWECVDTGLRIKSPFHDGRYGQYENRTKEAVARFFYGGMDLMRFPFAFGSLLLGKILRLALQKIDGASFVHIKGSAEEKKDSEDFTVMSLNVDFNEGVLGKLFGGMPCWCERIDGIAEKILEKDPDILCLEEVNSEEAEDAHIDALKSKYAHFYVRIGADGIGLSSGLFVASKFKISDPEFIPFTETVGVQKFVKKGFFHAKVKGVDLFHTHLQADWEEHPIAVRQRQLEVIKKKIEEIEGKGEASKRPSIVLGDLNILARSNIVKIDEYDKLTGFFEDSLQGNEEPTCTEFFEKYFPNKSNKDNGLEERLDYFLTRGFSGYEINTEIVPTWNKDFSLFLSDHHALFTKVKKVLIDFTDG